MKKTFQKCCTDGCTSGACIWFLGFIGAAIYYIGMSTSFGTGVVGFLKALVWPVFLVKGLLSIIG